MAVEPRPGRALQVAAAASDPDGFLLGEQALQVGRYSVREAPPCDAHAHPAGRGEREVAFLVAFEGMLGAVGAPDVEFDDEPAVVPDRVRFDGHRVELD